MTLQLADGTIQHPIGFLEDIHVEIRKIIFPCDFIILEMPVDPQTPIILGKSNLAIAGTVIDVNRGRLSLEVGDNNV